MRRDEEVREDPVALTTLPPIGPPSTAGQETRGSVQRLDSNIVALQEGVAIALVFKVDAQFAVNYIADDQRTSGRRVLQSRGGTLKSDR